MESYPTSSTSRTSSIENVKSIARKSKMNRSKYHDNDGRYKDKFMKLELEKLSENELRTWSRSRKGQSQKSRHQGPELLVSIPKWASNKFLQDPDLFPDFCKADFIQVLDDLLLDERTNENASQFLTFDDVDESTRPELLEFCDCHEDPLTISKILKNLQENLYKTPDDFDNDVLSMFQNFIAFFPKSHDMVSSAKELRSAFCKKYQRVLARIIEQLSSADTKRSRPTLYDRDPDWSPVDNSSVPPCKSVSPVTSSKSVPYEWDPDWRYRSPKPPKKIIKPRRITSSSASSTSSERKSKESEKRQKTSSHDDQKPGCSKTISNKSVAKAKKSRNSERSKDRERFKNAPSEHSSKNTRDIPLSIPTSSSAIDTMSYNEKATLLTEIYELQEYDREKIESIVNLIRVREPDLDVEDWDDFEIDLDVLTPSTLRELKVFVALQLKKKLPKLLLSLKRTGN